MGIYATVMETLEAYTGLSPMAFFTILALMVGIYRLVCGMFVAPEETKASHEEHLRQAMASNTISPPVILEPVQLGDVTEEELRAYDGSDLNKPLLMAIKGCIYDVSKSRMFYGPGGSYALFAGRDASRALALMSFDANDLTGNIEGLSRDELEVLEDWEYKFTQKYVKVGRLVTERTRAEGTENEEKISENQEAKGEPVDSKSTETAAGTN